MKTYRFVTTTHHDVVAETLEEAVESFNEMKRTGHSPEVDTVVRVEVKDERGAYIPVDRPMRAEYSDATKEAPSHLLA